MAEQVSNQWYALPAEEALHRLGTDLEQGLSQSEVTRRQAEHGKNQLPVEASTSVWEILKSQFMDVMVIVLIAAAVISLFIGDTSDAIVILAIVVLNAALGLFQEYQAEQALAALSAMQTPHVRVRRDGHVQEISAIDLVPGDIILMEAGDRVPADGRLLETINLQIDESALTGESLPVEKNTAAIVDDEHPPALAERHNLAYMGTAAAFGRGIMIVTETGLKTELGAIASMLQQVEKGRTPLQERLEKVGFVLASAALAICVVVFIAGVLRGEDVREMALTSISLAVAAIPEGLPAVITIALALGARRMIKRNALIRKLPAVETLGSVMVICSDKTGTLTRNEMTATWIALPGRSEDVMVDGSGYEPVGAFHAGNHTIDRVLDDPVLKRLITAGMMCNNAFLEHSQDNGRWEIVGDTTEGALLVLGRKAGLVKRSVLDADFPRETEIPFSSERKAMTTLHPVQGQQDLFAGTSYVSFTKGAPDQLVNWAVAERLAEGLSPLTDQRRNEWRKRIEEMASHGLRVIGLAYRDLDSIPDTPTPETIERNLNLLGLVGIVDPPRSEAKEAVKKASEAGIRSVMITGDHKLTAVAIARQLGIMHEGDQAFTGIELDKMSDEDLQNVVTKTSVYARVSPEHKLRVVEAWQAHNMIVAMTGDGVNDAPALKQANIGVAMGITGTDVSKGAADMILTDDNFATIVAAVEEGRTIYDNIRKFIRYLLGTNSGEILTMFGALMIGLRVPLLAIQLLWINLVTDGLPAVALGFEPSEPDVMKRKPRPPRESIFARGLGLHVIWVGAWLAVCTLIGYIWVLNRHGGEIFHPAESPLRIARTMTFTVLALSQLAHVLAIHAGEASFFSVPLRRVRILLTIAIITALLQLVVAFAPFAQRIMKTASLDLTELIVAGVLSMSIFGAVECEKVFRRRRTRRANSSLREGI